MTNPASSASIGIFPTMIPKHNKLENVNWEKNHLCLVSIIFWLVRNLSMS